MARTAALVESLKRELRARDITYAAVARRLGMSEAAVKTTAHRGYARLRSRVKGRLLEYR